MRYCFKNSEANTNQRPQKSVGKTLGMKCVAQFSLASPQTLSHSQSGVASMMFVSFREYVSNYNTLEVFTEFFDRKLFHALDPHRFQQPCSLLLIAIVMT